jgi:hypothetical protein
MYGHLFNIDQISILLFWMTNFLYLGLAYYANDFLDKIILCTIFIASFTFHTVQIWHRNLLLDYRVIKCMHLDIIVAISIFIILVIKYYYKIDQLTIIVLIISLILLLCCDEETLIKGEYKYIITHSLWHIATSWVLFRLLFNL